MEAGEALVERFLFIIKIQSHNIHSSIKNVLVANNTTKNHTILEKLVLILKYSGNITHVKVSFMFLIG